MSATTDLMVWIHWLRKYQSFEGKFSVPIAYELERVMLCARDEILSLQTEIDILKAKEGAPHGRDSQV